MAVAPKMICEACEDEEPDSLEEASNGMMCCPCCLEERLEFEDYERQVRSDYYASR